MRFLEEASLNIGSNGTQRNEPEARQGRRKPLGVDRQRPRWCFGFPVEKIKSGGKAPQSKDMECGAFPPLLFLVCDFGEETFFMSRRFVYHSPLAMQIGETCDPPIETRREG